MKYIILALIFLAGLCACDAPNTDVVVNEFKKQFPKYTFVDASVGEGDSDNSYVHVRYKKTEDGRIYEKVYLVQQINGGQAVSSVSSADRE